MTLKPKSGMGLIGLLAALAVFALMLTAFNKWAAGQRQRAVGIFRLYQAVQIAENQGQRQFLGMNCEPTVQQNGSVFQISCQSGEIRVRYGRQQDEIVLKTQ